MRGRGDDARGERHTEACPVNATPTSTIIRRGPRRSAVRLTIATSSALRPVLTMYSPDSSDRENPVSSIIESMKIEKTKDCPGPLLKATSAPTPTITQP